MKHWKKDLERLWEGTEVRVREGRKDEKHRSLALKKKSKFCPN